MYSRYISFGSVGSELIDINEFQKAHYTCYLFLVPDVAFISTKSPIVAYFSLMSARVHQI